MPDVLVEVRGDGLKERKAHFIEEIEHCIASVLRTPEDDKILRLIEHAPENFSVPRWAGERFTHIEITLFKGRGTDVMRALYRAMVQHLEPFGIPASDIKIILIEVLPSEIGMRGGRAACDLDIGYAINV